MHSAVIVNNNERVLQLKFHYLDFKHEHLDSITLFFAGSATGITALFGGWDKVFQVLLICVILDIITGIIKGLAFHDFSSKRMRKGFLTKIGYFIVIALATQFDKLMPEEFNGLPLLRTLAIFFYVAVEASSILENLAQMGVPVPQAIIDRLAVLQSKSGEKKSSKEKI
ncbi:phage holin family protein [Priestia megaterium]|uniref:phage holin family protein n=1 Tax=Priestia megaterium TaxID=1404 RepID=UPI002E1B93AC|nr:phage holin family protein [Priestia megaterium]